MASNWGKTQVLSAPDALLDYGFGWSIALSESRALIGTNWEANTDGSGSAYIFRRSGNLWLEETRLTASDAAMQDGLGTAVALSSDTALLGAHLDDDDGVDSGSAYAVSLACLGGGFATAFCSGDGSVNFCPCSNESAPGAEQGCTNSSGVGGQIDPLGSYSVAADDLVIVAELAVHGIALLEVADLPRSLGFGSHRGDGPRCIDVNVRRLGVRLSDSSGTATWGPGLGAVAGWSPYASQFFQVGYRDHGGPCGSGFNFTNGLQVIFVP